MKIGISALHPSAICEGFGEDFEDLEIKEIVGMSWPNDCDRICPPAFRPAPSVRDGLSGGYCAAVKSHDYDLDATFVPGEKSDFNVFATISECEIPENFWVKLFSTPDRAWVAMRTVPPCFSISF
jgi:hypothetical protein